MIFAAVLLTVGAIAFTLLVRDKDIPLPEPKTGYEHLEERKARIYEGLRDLQFEYRVGKLSDADYQSIKVGLQAELAGVLAEIDRIKGLQPAPRRAAETSSSGASAAPAPAFTCPHCGANFPVPLKFCGECGKAIA
jgi:hypothetical protein